MKPVIVSIICAALYLLHGASQVTVLTLVRVNKIPPMTQRSLPCRVVDPIFTVYYSCNYTCSCPGPDIGGPNTICDALAPMSNETVDTFTMVNYTLLNGNYLASTVFSTNCRIPCENGTCQTCGGFDTICEFSCVPVVAVDFELILDLMPLSASDRTLVSDTSITNLTSRQSIVSSQQDTTVADPVINDQLFTNASAVYSCNVDLTTLPNVTHVTWLS